MFASVGSVGFDNLVACDWDTLICIKNIIRPPVHYIAH